MKRKFLAVILAALWLYQLSCVVQSRVRLSPEGQGIRVDLKSGQRVKGELLSFQDRTFYILDKSEGPGRIVRISGADVASVQINSFRNSNWIPFVIGFEVLPAAVLTGTQMSTNNGDLNPAMLLTFLPALFTTLGFATVESKESFEDVLIGSDLPIRKHARFPQGLTPDQLDELLRQFGQKESVLIK
jgi:hypothetical protein